MSSTEEGDANPNKTVDKLNETGNRYAGLIALTNSFLAIVLAIGAQTVGAAIGLGIHAVTAFIVLSAGVSCAMFWRRGVRDITVYAVTFVMTAMAIAVIYFLPSMNTRPVESFKYITGELYLDENGNGQKDGNDAALGNVEVVLMHRSRREGAIYTNSDGEFRLEIPNSLVDVNIIVCGISQSHRIPRQSTDNVAVNAGLDIQAAYHLKIGVEQAVQQGC